MRRQGDTTAPGGADPWLPPVPTLGVMPPPHRPASRPARRRARSTLVALVAPTLVAVAVVASGCATTVAATAPVRRIGPGPARPAAPNGRPAGAAGTAPAGTSPASHGTGAQGSAIPGPNAPLAPPAPLAPFGSSTPGQGTWQPAGRLVGGVPAVYETTLVPPGGSQPAGVAWMDTRLLSARLYSGSRSPGGGPYRYSAPIQPAQAASLVAAFNGGFMMNVAGGGYYTDGRTVVPLQQGAASLVITTGGNVNVGAWGTDVTMAPDVVSVRQNLVPLVASGQPTAQAAGPDWLSWGATCGATSCASSVPGIENQWRSGVGVTADGALVYAAGPALSPLQLAQLLARAGVVRGMQLDINPDWPDFATYDPPPGGLASPSNGTKLLATTVQGPWTFFESWWARDFVTMSARPTLAG